MMWPFLFLAHAWGQRTNNNNGSCVLAHKHLATHSMRCLVSTGDKNNGVKIYCQGVGAASAGWQLQADRWAGVLRSPVFTLMNVRGFPSLYHCIERVVFVAPVALSRTYLSVSMERQVASSSFDFPEINDAIDVKAICS